MRGVKRQIVDSDDRLVDHKLATDINFASDIYRVSALWLTNSKGEILIAQRGFQTKNSPGLWGPAVAGTVDEGETYESNIYKEAEEEIGLAGIIFAKSHKIRHKMRTADTRNYFCQWFTAMIDREADKFILNDGEVLAVKWVSESDLLQDISNNPKKYIEEMEEIARIFVEGVHV